jgi:hypothetical protein
MSKTKKILLWTSAVVLTCIIAFYQRTTGPTYPIKGKVDISGSTVDFKLLRSQTCGSQAQINIIAADKSIGGEYIYKRFKSHDTLTRKALTRSGDTLIAKLPELAPAGKVQYQIEVSKNDKKLKLDEEPVVLRYKGDVPAYILIPHIILMFASMLFGARAMFEAFYKGEKTYKYSLWSAILLFIGGLIVGPFVQYFAFGAFWTGWPFGGDMTDNKTLAALIFWAVAAYKLKKNNADYKWAIIAFAAMLIVYLIPHSVLGSEIDYTKIPNN